MNLRKLCLIVAVSSFTVLVAQNAPVSSSDRIIEEPDIMPIYQGGTSEMHRFIANTLKYPVDARERDAQGLVVYTFVVEKDGSLSNFTLVHRADPSLNEEALRILQIMPPWHPARHKGQIVRSETYVPMYFKLNRSAADGDPVQPVRNYSKTDLVIIESNTIYTIVDKMPEYTYGESGLAAFIAHHLRYPDEARQKGIEGRVLCSFIVADDGTLSNIEVVSGPDEVLNAEAVRVLGLVPRWIPGENEGEKVYVKCLYPIDFVKE
jgi:TonB family protein